MFYFMLLDIYLKVVNLYKNTRVFILVFFFS